MFTQSLAALFAAPALPALPAAAPVATQIPTQARFWAIYFAGLNGQCSPAILQKALNVPLAQAEGFVAELVREGVIKPNPFFHGVKEVLKRPSVTAQADDPGPKLREVVETVEDQIAEEDPVDPVGDDGDAVECPAVAEDAKQA